MSSYRDVLATAQEVLIDCFANQTQPYSGANPAELAAMLAASEVCPEIGIS